MSSNIKPRERKAIIQSLQAGVVPQIGLHHIQVGRKDEVAAVMNDLESIESGSSSIRFIIGDFGSGKTFFLNLMRTVALEKKFAVVQADITTDRRIQAKGGQARALYTELIKNMATKAKPQGGALQSIVERWISEVDHQVRSAGGDQSTVEREIHQRLQPLQDFVAGYDFSSVIAQYLRGYLEGNDELRQSAVRWLRAEYTTKTEARQDLGVRSIIDDASFYDYLKLMAAFVKIAGYNGLLVNLDEMVVLSHRLTNTQARNANYEAILRILNDCLQGGVSNLGFLFGGTHEFLADKRRGLFSYAALERRLAMNTFATEGRKDFAGPVIRMDNLSPEDLYVLLVNIRRVFTNGESETQILPDEGLVAFMTHCDQHLGSEYFKTPGDSVKMFVNYLNVIAQNPKESWSTLLGNTPVIRQQTTSEPHQINTPSNPSGDNPKDSPVQDELVTFKL